MKSLNIYTWVVDVWARLAVTKEVVLLLSPDYRLMSKCTPYGNSFQVTTLIHVADGQMSHVCNKINHLITKACNFAFNAQYACQDTTTQGVKLITVRVQNINGRGK